MKKGIILMGLVVAGALTFSQGTTAPVKTTAKPAVAATQTKTTKKPVKKGTKNGKKTTAKKSVKKPVTETAAKK